MENCLVAKLKGVVDDNKLPKLGCLTLSLSLTNSFPSNLISTESGYLDVEILTDGVTFGTASGSSEIIDGKHAKIRASYGNNVSLDGVPADGTVIVSVGSKYDITELFGVSAGSGKNQTLDLGIFKYMQKLEKLNIQAKRTNKFDVKGSIDILPNITSLTTIKLQYCNVSGDIEALGCLTALTELSFPQMTSNINFITGNWKSFVEEQRANNRVSCDSLTLSSMSRYSKIEFGTAGIPRAADSENAILSWDSDKIAFKYNNSKKIYVIGYSAEEIASLEGEGYTVIVSD